MSDADATAGDQAAEAAAEAPDADADLDLAKRLHAAQKLVAELKRADFIEAGGGGETRAKFVGAFKNYEQLREEVLRRRLARLDDSDTAEKRRNYELLFNGVTSHVELPTLVYNGENPYTIEAIISPEPIPAFQVNPEIHQYAHSMAIVADTEFGGVELGLNPEGLSFDMSSEEQGWYVTAAKACLPFVETRVHVAGVLDGEELRLYKNGELVDSKPFPGAVRPSHFTMRIGCSPHPVTGTHEMFCGRIDEVRFSRAAQYTDSFKPPTQLEVDEATDALYHFDEGRGDKVRDASGKNHHGIVQDARWAPVEE